MKALPLSAEILDGTPYDLVAPRLVAFRQTCRLLEKQANPSVGEAVERCMSGGESAFCRFPGVAPGAISFQPQSV